MDTSSSPPSTRRWRRTSRGSAGRLAVGVVLLALLLAMPVLAFTLPVTADVVQPPRPGYEWAGVPPKITVECGPLLNPATPTFPEGTRYVTAGSRAAAVSACTVARPQRWTMALGSGGVAVLLLGAVVLATARSRRQRRHALITPM